MSITSNAGLKGPGEELAEPAAFLDCTCCHSGETGISIYREEHTPNSFSVNSVAPTCMKILILSCFYILLTTSLPAMDWPKEIRTSVGGTITVYQPQPESLTGNKLEGRTAFSARAMAGDDLTFGVFWFTASIATDRDSRIATMESILVKEIKLPGITDTTKISRLRKLLNEQIPKWQITASLDDIIATIEQEQILATVVLKNDPPLIYYKEQPTTLVLMDGEPVLKEDPKLKMKRVINSAFLIVENPEDKNYFLYGGQFWYTSKSVKDGFQPISTLPKKISSLDQQLKKEQRQTTDEKASAPAIFVSTVPAELLQASGPADFASIPGTSLLYMSNSGNDIFKYLEDQQYYVLLSGRWYSSAKLEGPWVYIASDKLPSDFAKIPEGSPKDNVLASVAGTQESKDAIMDAQVPQTAKVDRKKATCTVAYDGEPKFEKIEGTSMELAMNTSSTVIKSESKYYCVESGVWFVSENASGPWKVSEERPKEVTKIPASSPAFNVQYVYIYESTPAVVYVGYTPGYMGCYVYGSTVVYGTGYYYQPWYGPYYYPRPVTYGFSMHYNPWMGWSMGFHYSAGFFSFHGYYHGGYWGPPMYHPPYHPPYHGGMYGNRGPQIDHHADINRGNSNNMYGGRNGVNTNDVKRGDQGRPSTMDQNRAGPRNDVYAGRDGSVNQRNDNGNWNQRNGNQWQNNANSMDRDFQNRERSNRQNTNFNQMNRGGGMGGMRGGGGRGR
jgi:hypothetical protein